MFASASAERAPSSFWRVGLAAAAILVTGTLQAAEFHAGAMLDMHKMHFKISRDQDATNLWVEPGIEFDVSPVRYGIWDSSGILNSIVGGAAQTELNRQKAERDAVVRADAEAATTGGRMPDSVTYSYEMVAPPVAPGLYSYVAKWGSASGEKLAWSGTPLGKGASFSGMDFGVAFPTYDAFVNDYDVRLGVTWEGQVRDITFGTFQDTLFADPLSLHVLYQPRFFPWVVADAKASWSPMMGLMGALFGGSSQQTGYGIGLRAYPLKSVSVEANYEIFNGSFISSTYRTINTSDLSFAVKWDLVEFYELMSQ
jgi:hypothetical protein